MQSRTGSLLIKQQALVGPSAFVPNAVEFDGTNDYMSGDNSGRDISELVCSFWAKVPKISGGGTLYQHLVGLDFEFNAQVGVGIYLTRTATQIQWQIIIFDWDPFGPDGPTATGRWTRSGLLSSSFTANAWHHYYARMRFTNNTFDLRIDGTSVSGINDLNPFNFAATGWENYAGVFGGSVSDTGGGGADYFPGFDGQVSQFWYGHPNTSHGTGWDYTDFVNADGTPKALPTNGIIRGYSPQVYLPNGAADFNLNQGTTGDFTLVGALANVAAPTLWNT